MSCAQAAPFLGPMDPAFAKDILKKLNSPGYHTPHALMHAIAYLDPMTMKAEGLVQVRIISLYGCTGLLCKRVNDGQCGCVCVDARVRCVNV